VPGLTLRNPACVRKTFPNFFDKLASLGAGVVEVATGGRLEGDSLLAD
jgi:3-phosphoshikimate 1-carboxyvinyltransferase